MPRIILLLMYDRLPKKEVKFTRHNIFERDKNTCQYCGRVFDRKDLNLDHVIPRDRGGPTTWENIVCSCIECNTQKANRTPQEAGLRLIRKPKRPKWRPFVQINFSLHRHDSWKHFIDLAYWNVELGEDVESTVAADGAKNRATSWQKSLADSINSQNFGFSCSASSSPVFRPDRNRKSLSVCRLRMRCTTTPSSCRSK